MRNILCSVILLTACGSSPRLDEVGARGLMGGEMVYMADAARFTDCRTNRSYPMAMEADFVSAERAYLADVSEAGRPLFVTFDGEIAARPRMEGDGTEPTVIVQQFVNTWPNQNCEQSRADADLENTYWRLVKLGEEKLAPAEGEREPRLTLRKADGETRYAATVGCNQLMGRYEVAGDRITFSMGASTKMACPGELGAREDRFVQVLNGTRQWRIVGNTMQLLDESGASLALFEAVYM